MTIQVPIWSGFAYSIFCQMPPDSWCVSWRCYGHTREEVESVYRSAMATMRAPAYRVICRRKDAA